ncbi:type 2 isopentenyl-diphosphate Delta-isomerase [Paenibacillus antri]|uniref:Isopentenyl-diphosphate delta-isomerase n=1 Tax=Paenibacillus antri TaxID=2582848 RepID=A0A5R9GFC0_9BACL|nr:type 2 isopentenyl-diphosphate Delta-isomerase [Paenibacillus antri]TLS53076.1 type 2 isopentenyl-diphosphate Delta-isomerase [Paenibacillus antri]
MTRMSRKMDHVRHALASGQSGRNGLSEVRFVHNPLPDTSVSHISLTTRIGELTMRSPILINAMTGGAAETEEINYGLGEAARLTGVAMAVGSQMAALRDPALEASYAAARRANPDGLLFANLGSEATPEQAKRAVEMIRADALQIHLNVVQELVMPEGDRSFEGALRRIERIVRNVDVPVIAKEVGFGMTMSAASRLLSVGVSAVDCGGSGGTNFARIENARRDRPIPWFDDWGNTTAVSLLEAKEAAPAGRLIGSGGIRNGMEAAKSIALGADAVGLAGALLRKLREEGVEAVAASIRDLQEELRLVMTAVGARTIPELQSAPVVIVGDTAEWCAARGVDIRKYARRAVRPERETDSE